jgi:hypothetical protein
MTKLLQVLDRAGLAFIEILVLAGLPLAAVALATNAL